MKLAIVGLGQCGCNIADAFYAVNRYSESVFGRNIEILTDVFAVNTDETDLGGFRNIPKDKGHRILVGTMSTFGHGVGKMNRAAADIIKATSSVVIDSVLKSVRVHESDAIFVIASAGGGTGSGTTGWIIKRLKERIDRPIYAVLVLPFAFEERGDISYAVTNSATCINTVTRYADATFIFDNECYRKAGGNLAKGLKEINREIAMSFYDLCCAGEEKRQKYVGSKVVDAGDIKQSLEGISVISKGQVNLSTFHWRRGNFREGIKEHSLMFAALRQAETNLGLGADIAHARKVLVLMSAPKNVITLAALEEIYSYIQQKAPKAVIRMGDYPRNRREIAVTLMVSQLTKMTRLEHLFVQAGLLLQNQEQLEKEAGVKTELMQEINQKIPRLD